MSDEPVCQHPGCNAFPCNGEGYCINHTEDPDLQAKLQAGRSRGGAAVRSRLSATPGDVEKHLPDKTQESALEAQLTAVASMLAMLESDPANLKVATALSQACGRLSRQLAMHDLEERLVEIEKKLEIGKRKRAK